MNIKKTALRLPRLDDIIPSVMLILASRASVLGMMPFGIAFFAAVFGQRLTYIGVAAVCIGILTSGGVALLPKYLIAMMIFRLAIRYFRRSGEFLRAAFCGVSLLMGGAIMMLGGIDSLYSVFLLVTESVIAALMCIVFSKSQIVSDDFSKRGRMGAEEYICAAVAVGAIISGLNGLFIGVVGISNIMSVYVILITALNASVAVSAATGLCIGFMLSMSSSSSLIMMGIFGMCAVFASLMNGYKRIGCAIGYMCGAAISLIYAKSAYELPINIYDSAVGAVLFIATPAVVHEYFRTFFDKSVQVEKVDPMQRMRQYLTARLRSTGDAFGSLHECFLAVSEGRLKKYSDDMGAILDETATRVCKSCKLRGKCWQTDFRRTYKNILELVGIIEAEGALTPENAPSRFCERCERANIFIYEINHVYELYRRDMLRRADAVTTRNLISNQYNELHHLLDMMASDIESGFIFLENEEERIVDALDSIGVMPYEVSVVENAGGSCEIYLRLPPTVHRAAVEGVLSSVMDRAVAFEKSERGLSKYVSRPGYIVDCSVLQLPQHGSNINGDSVTVFTDSRSRFFAIAADGMGSGREAQYESAAVLRLLTSFLKAGIGVMTAISILNSSMCINMDREMFSTIDLLCIDLYTGKAELYKIGSAETMLLSGGDVKAISAASAPIGIVEHITPDRKRLELAEGDIVLLMTDGITESGYTVSKTDWIRSILIKPHNTMDELAHEVIDTALSKSRGTAEDDMSVIALRVMGV